MEARIGQIKKDHDIILKSREKLTISGVQEIINFDVFEPPVIAATTRRVTIASTAKARIIFFVFDIRSS